jgi:hypothetical protein
LLYNRSNGNARSLGYVRRWARDKVLNLEEPPYTTVSTLAGTADSALPYSLIVSTLSSGRKIIVGGR